MASTESAVDDSPGLGRFFAPYAMVITLLRAGRVVMRMIIGRPLTPLNALKDDAGRSVRRDDNSRNKVQNVRGDSSANDYSLFIRPIRRAPAIWSVSENDVQSP